MTSNGQSVGALLHGGSVFTPLQAVDALGDWRSAQPTLRSTSLSALDRVCDGFASGRIWLITGTPSQGRSTLSIQWALQLATRHGMRTHLVSAREPIHLVAARLLAAASKVPVSHLWTDEITNHDEAKLRRARLMLTEAPLRIVEPRRPSVLTWDPPQADIPDALVIDDADLEAGAFPERLAEFAGQGVLVIATLPKHQVISPDGIDPAWARVADHILDVERPDVLDPNSHRPGEADLHLVRNRWGPQTVTAVAFQGHYARFVDLERA
jgi:replicative DNA helicase